MAGNDPIYFRLIQEQISVQNELIRVIKDDLEYRQGLQQKAMAEGGGLLRAKDDQVQQILSASNAVAPDWGTPGTRARGRRVSSRRMEQEGQLNLAPDSEERTDPDQQLMDRYEARIRERAYDPSRDDPRQDVPPGYQPTSESRPLPPDSRRRSGSFASDFRQERGPTRFERELEAARPPLTTLQRLRKAYNDAPGGMLGGARAALGSFATPLNLPPDSAGADQGGGNEQGAAPAPGSTGGGGTGGTGGGSTGGGGGTGGGGTGDNPNDPFHMGNQDTQTAMTWAMMGEHGGPAWMRNLYLGSWQMRQGFGWGSRNTDAFRTALQNPDSMQSKVVGKIPGLGNVLNENTLGAVSGALRLAKDNSGYAYVGYRALRGTGNFISNRFAQLRDYQAMGQQYGYGPSAMGGQAMFGVHNPLGDFSTAAQVGAAYDMETQALQGRIPGAGFGGGLTGQQAQEDVQSLAGQGFGMQPFGGGVPGAIATGVSTIPGIGKPLAGVIGSVFGDQPTGDAATIAQNLDRPLQRRFPGLTGEDINQFTPTLRHSGTSVQQLVDQLDSLGVQARATKETIGEFTSSVHQTGQAFAGLGSSAQGGQGVGLGFSAATGMDPQTAGQIAQNPLFQGMAMSRYGILPSGLGQMNPGSFTQMSMDTISMLQRGLGGLNQDKYETINGRRVLVQSGHQAQAAQIASMTGLPYNEVNQMMGDQGPIRARAQADKMLGDPTQGTGIYEYLGGKEHHLNAKQYRAADAQWKATVDPYLVHAVGKQRAADIDKHTGMWDRARALRGAITETGKDDPWNQINQTPGNTVQVQFTGQAAKFFQQVGGGGSPSPAKQSANAAWSGGNWNPGGGGAFSGYNKIANSTTGDLSGGASSSAWDYMNGGG